MLGLCLERAVAGDEASMAKNILARYSGIPIAMLNCFGAIYKKWLCGVIKS